MPVGKPSSPVWAMTSPEVTRRVKSCLVLMGTEGAKTTTTMMTTTTSGMVANTIFTQGELSTTIAPFSVIQVGKKSISDQT